MKSIAIVFSSQSGSTRKIAERLKVELEGGGATVDLFDIKDAPLVDLAAYDLVGLGGPTYMFRPSFVILDFIDRNESLRGKRVFTFVTYGSEIGDAHTRLKNRLRKVGAILIGGIECRGRHLFPGYTRNGYFFSPHNPDSKELDRVASFAKAIVSPEGFEKGESGESRQKTHIVSKFERFVFNRFFIKRFFSPFFSRDMTTCVSCGNCQSNCPTSNIVKDEKGRLAWGRDCIFCLSCEISCPNKSISSPISWPLFKPFLLYNIRRTKKKGICYEGR